MSRHRHRFLSRAARLACFVFAALSRRQQARGGTIAGARACVANCARVLPRRISNRAAEMVRARAVSGKRPRESDSEDFDPEGGSDFEYDAPDSLGIPVQPRPSGSGRRAVSSRSAPALGDDDDEDDGEIEAQLGNSLISLETGGALGNAASAVALATAQAAQADAAKPRAPGERKKSSATSAIDAR